jgi:CxxC-x17-CxxC domain-containing protein
VDFTDKQLQCVDCGKDFIFSAEEQEFFAEKGYTNEPKRCVACRQARRSARGEGGDNRSSVKKYPAICAECGQPTEVPFEPRQGRPVYCSNCFSRIKQQQQDLSAQLEEKHDASYDVQTQEEAAAPEQAETGVITEDPSRSQQPAELEVQEEEQQEEETQDETRQDN